MSGYSSEVVITVESARGHGPNAVLPHEVAWVELWTDKTEDNIVETSKTCAKDGKISWNKVMRLKGVAVARQGENPVLLHVRLRGAMAGGRHQSVDEIGQGTVILTELGAKKSLSVPIFNAAGKQAGEVVIHTSS